MSDICSQITFLYYDGLGAAQHFIEEILELSLVEDQNWAKIYQVAEAAYLGIVDEKQGTLQSNPDSSTLVTLVVNDVDSWYQRLRNKDVDFLREIETFEEIQVRSFFIEGPGGYKFEIQEFLAPESRDVFHH